MSTTHSSLLRNTLYGNSVFSILSGLACMFFSTAIANFLGLSASWIIFALGIGLILYGIEIYVAARANPVHKGIATFAVYADLAWVIVSALLIFANLADFTTAGKWAIAIVADIVLVFAILQFVGLRRLKIST
ncbi:MAG TPA: hypothetical protein VN843_03735 [Anaerolineales bacterium]|nr:hypothetical protein [Anaerolineales bacterium]